MKLLSMLAYSLPFLIMMHYTISIVIPTGNGGLIAFILCGAILHAWIGHGLYKLNNKGINNEQDRTA